MLILKGHEPGLYEALSGIAGPFFIFTMVKMKSTPINNSTLKINVVIYLNCKTYFGILDSVFGPRTWTVVDKV